MKVINSLSRNVLLVLTPIVLLSGCKPLDWIKSKLGGDKPSTVQKVEMGKLPQDAGSATLAPSTNTVDLPAGMLAVWGDGSSMVSQAEFDAKLALLMKEKPELKDVAEAFLPMLKAQLLTQLIYLKVIKKWAEENKVDQLPEFKEKLEQILNAAKEHLSAEFLAKELSVEPTSSELKDYYEKNKDRVALISRGGTKAIGVQFEDEAAAKAFLDKAKGAKFDKAVEESKLKEKMQDFNFVNRQSRGIDRILVRKIMDIKKVPATELIKVNDKTFWVVNATEKKDAEYQPYAEVKDTVEAVVKQTKQGELMQKKLEELKAKYGVKVKEKAFMPPTQQQAMIPPQIQEEAMKQAAAQQEGKEKTNIANTENKDVKPVTKAA